MQISEKTLYNEYLSRQRRKQNRGAWGTRDSERGKTYSAEFEMLSMIDNPTFKDIEEAHTLR